MPKKAADKKFQIHNNLVPALLCLVIDWNRFKQRSKRVKTVMQTATETIGNGDKRKRIIEAYAQTERMPLGIFELLVHGLDDMFSGFNTAR